MLNFRFIFIMAALLCYCTYISAQKQTDPSNQSEELGTVQWHRNYDEALALAQKEEKDVLILFQEVPGCATCRNYGHNVLSHPLMVEAIENLFVPLAIFNNKKGKDAEILKQYSEPSWNNPVVRIVNHKGENVTDRLANDYSALGLCKRMQTALTQKKAAIPKYMHLLQSELSAAKSNSIETTYFTMYCFWSGEKQLGAMDGVLYVESGFMRGKEVVKVKYDKNLTTEKEIAKQALQYKIAPIEKDGSYTLAAKDLHYYLQQTNYKYLPLTELQRTKINSALGYGQPAEQYLSPQQLQWLNAINTANKKRKVLFSIEFVEAWEWMVNKF